MLLMSVFVLFIYLLWLLMINVYGTLVYVLIGIYVNYWILSLGLLVLMVMFYYFIDNLIVLLGILPLMMMFIKQNVLILLLMVKIVVYVM